MMNKFVVYVIGIIMLLPLAGCQEEKHYRIGISQCSQDDWRKKMNDEINREVMFHPDAEVEIRSADDSNKKQIADIRYFMDNDFDIIIAAPNEADAITPIIQEVYDKGIPVIVFDRDINGDKYTARQGVDNYGIGKAAAQYAHNLIGDNGKVIEIYGLAGSTPAIDRHNGFLDESKSNALNIVGGGYGNWNYEDASVVADSLFSLYSDADLVYAHNDRMAIAASEVAKKRGISVKIIGIDAAPEIGIKAVAEGEIDATFLYPTEGYRLIRTALAILKGEPYDKEVLLPLSSAVDKSNADILLLQNESLKEETAKIKLLKSQVDDYWNRHSAQTTLFYAAIAILVLLFGFLFMVLRAFWLHKRHQKILVEQNKQLAQQRDTEKNLNEQLSAVTQSKLMFFTNVSHDLRTPLTLIAEPVEQLEAADYLTPQHRALMKIANKNVKILRRLINQILDFRKYENGKLQVNLTEVHIAELIRDWTESFTAIARKREIKLSIDILVESSVTLAIDTEKIERVFFNLMSNAFKYTPNNGKIHFVCTCDDSRLIFSVEDTGQGIAVEDLGNIFDRFYQVDKIHPNGSGIGLSLAKAFVELHGGSIEVESTLGKGSKFTVRIPVRHVEVVASEVARVITDSDINAELGDIDIDNLNESDDKPLLLVIDDNADIRNMIRELLSDEYRIIEAPNGKEGIRLASKYVPDLIICDVMMPVMDGLECCRRIKEEITTSHIPVLMLTACSMDEQRIQGYESGADGYLSKPFNSKMLRMRCENLIENRKRIKNVFDTTSNIVQNIPDTKTEKKETPASKLLDIDNEFYARFIELVNKEMSNPELNIDAIATKMNLGRSQFYRKIKALTNYSPVELLRKIRLTQARDLLSTTDKPISEIAYEVGFSAPAYFARVFRELFGESPSDLRTRLGIKD
ncbi:MAG: substrate-binding domain-containing protein [Muribaculaceae bacterium]|nr:substrate-binding domain-containing protein [Muribaculaceae bacterium]